MPSSIKATQLARQMLASPDIYSFGDRGHTWIIKDASIEILDHNDTGDRWSIEYSEAELAAQLDLLERHNFELVDSIADL